MLSNESLPPRVRINKFCRFIRNDDITPICFFDSFARDLIFNVVVRSEPLDTNLMGPALFSSSFGTLFNENFK